MRGGDVMNHHTKVFYELNTMRTDLEDKLKDSKSKGDKAMIELHKSNINLMNKVINIVCYKSYAK